MAIGPGVHKRNGYTIFVPTNFEEMIGQCSGITTDVLYATAGMLVCFFFLRLERNVEGLLKYVPEVDSAIFQVRTCTWVPIHHTVGRCACAFVISGGALRAHRTYSYIRIFVEFFNTTF